MGRPLPGRGYWREDGEVLPARTAWEEWALRAREVLARLAAREGAVITYGELGRAVQSGTGVHTNVPLPHWIGQVLRRVAAEAGRAGEPPWTALVVHAADGTVGRECLGLLGPGEGPLPDEERETRAEIARRACYRHASATGARPPR
ncbi:hypothetical protein MF406_12430 [Georgenia sp. TF02-10]|uniref:hypothetical protein n=1 Tax=Georgenia sp. TF02-10 TaxID=2917725 RepID=UPI001FA6E2D5|nr:hypothetical protein [Georgenia sp. TF02-10]UNX53782.1 hypothetical protein MF406_12430 [Georgenia sp. TF02-10]